MTPWRSTPAQIPVAIDTQPAILDLMLWGHARLGIFTSGSTSRPKCVFLLQENLLAGARFVIEAHDLTRDDTAVCCMPLSHVNGVVTTILAPLLSGVKVVFLQRTFSPREFLGCMAKQLATGFSAAPLPRFESGKLRSYLLGKTSGKARKRLFSSGNYGRCRFCGPGTRRSAR